MLSIPHILWLLIVLVNFTDQLLYFQNDRCNAYFWVKKVTTPLLLFGGLALAMTGSNPARISIIVILAAMGIGELGIEGSSVVENTNRTRNTHRFEEIKITVSGLIFLLVNLLLGIVLLAGNSRRTVFITLMVSLVIYVVMTILFFIRFQPDKEDKFRIVCYSISLVVLMAGSIANIAGGLTALGQAGILLTLSDSLVLVRMGANFDKRNKDSFRILLGFLVVICILYYCYIAVLINASNPF